MWPTVTGSSLKRRAIAVKRCQRAFPDIPREGVRRSSHLRSRAGNDFGCWPAHARDALGVLPCPSVFYAAKQFRIRFRIGLRRFLRELADRVLQIRFKCTLRRCSLSRKKEKILLRILRRSSREAESLSGNKLNSRGFSRRSETTRPFRRARFCRFRGAGCPLPLLLFHVIFFVVKFAMNFGLLAFKALP